MFSYNWINFSWIVCWLCLSCSSEMLNDCRVRGPCLWLLLFCVRPHLCFVLWNSSNQNTDVLSSKRVSQGLRLFWVSFCRFPGSRGRCGIMTGQGYPNLVPFKSESCSCFPLWQVWKRNEKSPELALPVCQCHAPWQNQTRIGSFSHPLN